MTSINLKSDIAVYKIENPSVIICLVVYYQEVRELNEVSNNFLTKKKNNEKLKSHPIVMVIIAVCKLLQTFCICPVIIPSFYPIDDMAL